MEKLKLRVEINQAEQTINDVSYVRRLIGQRFNVQVEELRKDNVMISPRGNELEVYQQSQTSPTLIYVAEVVFRKKTADEKLGEQLEFMITNLRIV